MELTLTLNGVERTLSCAPGDTLLEVLRAAGARSVKQGCDCEGTCGACSVLLDGELRLACITPALRARGRTVTTVEGLGHPARPHPLQTALAEVGAVQCGFCTPGMILAAKALLDRDPTPSDDAIRDALSSNLCRCTGYVKILEGVRLAAARLAAAPRTAAGATRSRR
jgi:aerobic-type carbon monoxide dehydrogenase small subunit (CoxS/CutS family)